MVRLSETKRKGRRYLALSASSATAAMLLLFSGQWSEAQNAGSPSGAGLTVFAAGSLRAAMQEIGAEYRKQTGIQIKVTFGPSGVLRERIEAGERPDVFASADVASPAKLAEKKLGTPPRRFTANSVCAIVGPAITADSSTFLNLLLDPAIRPGTAIPIEDPLGDYTEAVFAKADTLRPGAKKLLDQKAVRLFGGKNVPSVPAGQEMNAYFLLSGKQADVMFNYCSGAQAALRSEPRLRIIQLPANLTVSAAFGYTIITGSRPSAADFGKFLESTVAADIFERQGFARE
jgi:molybdate transport system substrate-binding protein